MDEPVVGGRVLVVIAALAVALRLPRLWARWDEVTLAYAAYAEPTLAALQRGALADAATQWMGLHPPLWPLLHAFTELVAPSPLVWMGLSVAASTAAAVLVARVAGPVAGLVLATAPLQVAYAAEVHNYPLAVAMVAAVLAVARGPWVVLAVVAILAGWTHLLAGAAGVGVVLWRAGGLANSARPQAVRLVVTVGLGLAPIAAGAVRKMGQQSTFSQPDGAVGDWLAMAVEAAGWPGIAIGLVALVGLRRQALAAAIPVGLVLAVALFSGAAATHQRPYFLLVGPIVAVAAGFAARSVGRPLALGVGALCIGRAAWSGACAIDQTLDLVAQQDERRGVDVAVAQSGACDTVWLVSPALQADDDKTATAPVLWRMGPSSLMPLVRPVAFEYRDWRYGQPRVWRNRIVHTSTELYAAPFDHIASQTLAAGCSVWVVLYDHGPATGLSDRVARIMRPYAPTHSVVPTLRGLGDDHVWRLRGLPGGTQ